MMATITTGEQALIMVWAGALVGVATVAVYVLLVAFWQLVARRGWFGWDRTE